MMKQYQLWYDAPAKDWNIALPLGNGRMGAMVFGGTVLERISLNEDSCWYGGFRDRVNPDAKKYLPVVRQLLKEDRIAEAQQLAEEALAAPSIEEQRQAFIANHALTPREVDVLVAVTQDERPLKQIAEELGISMRMVQRHLSSIYQNHP